MHVLIESFHIYQMCLPLMQGCPQWVLLTPVGRGSVAFDYDRMGIVTPSMAAPYLGFLCSLKTCACCLQLTISGGMTLSLSSIYLLQEGSCWATARLPCAVFVFVFFLSNFNKMILKNKKKNSVTKAEALREKCYKGKNSLIFGLQIVELWMKNKTLVLFIFPFVK